MWPTWDMDGFPTTRRTPSPTDSVLRVNIKIWPSWVSNTMYGSAKEHCTTGDPVSKGMCWICLTINKWKIFTEVSKHQRRNCKSFCNCKLLFFILYKSQVIWQDHMTSCSARTKFSWINWHTCTNKAKQRVLTWSTCSIFFWIDTHLLPGAWDWCRTPAQYTGPHQCYQRIW